MKTLKEVMVLEFRQDIKEFDIEKASDFVNHFYNNYVDFDDFQKIDSLRKADRHTAPEEKYDVQKKARFILEHRLDLISQEKLRIYGLDKKIADFGTQEDASSVIENVSNVVGKMRDRNVNENSSRPKI